MPKIEVSCSKEEQEQRSSELNLIEKEYWKDMHIDTHRGNSSDSQK